MFEYYRRKLRQPFDKVCDEMPYCDSKILTAPIIGAQKMNSRVISSELAVISSGLSNNLYDVFAVHGNLHRRKVRN